MTIYIETIFLDNFLLDTLLFFLASGFLLQRSLRRIFLSGALGGAYAVLSACFPIFSEFYCKLPAGIFLCAVCFGWGKNLLRGSLSFFAAALLNGGVMFALLYCLAGTNVDFNVTRRLLLSGSLFTLLLIALLKRFCSQSPACPAEVEMRCGDAILKFRAEYDSGMTLTDESGRGAMLLNRRFAEEHLPRAYYEDILGCPYSVQCKTGFFRLRTAAGEICLIGFLPDELTLRSHTQTFRAVCYVLLADGIDLNGSPALYGRNLKTEES